MRSPIRLLPIALLLLLALPAHGAEPASRARLLAAADDAPAAVDSGLARESERFEQFAREQVTQMNANILGGKNSMQVQRDDFGLYLSSYKSIDLGSIVCQVRRADSDPRYFVGTVLYKEQIRECMAQDAESCRTGPFELLTEKAGRIIYSSKRGGGWN